MYKNVILKNINVDSKEFFEDSIKSERRLYKNVEKLFNETFADSDGYCLEFIIDKISWSKRMTRAAGNFRWYTSKKVGRFSFTYRFIEASKRVNKNSKEYKLLCDEFVETVKHELIHYYQSISDSFIGHDDMFKELFIKIGGSGDTYMTEELIELLG